MSRIERAGGEFVEIERPRSFVDLQQLNADIVAYEAYQHLATLVDDPSSILDPFVRVRVRGGAKISAAQYRETIEELQEVGRIFMDRFSGADALILPGTPLPAPTLDQVDEGQIPMSRYTRAANCLNLCAIALPIPPIAPNPLPTGIQLAMPFGEDAKLLALASTVECLVVNEKYCEA